MSPVNNDQQLSTIRKGEKFTDFIERVRGEEYKTEFYKGSENLRNICEGR